MFGPLVTADDELELAIDCSNILSADSKFPILAVVLFVLELGPVLEYLRLKALNAVGMTCPDSPFMVTSGIPVAAGWKFQ